MLPANTSIDAVDAAPEIQEWEGRDPFEQFPRMKGDAMIRTTIERNDRRGESLGVADPRVSRLLWGNCDDDESDRLMGEIQRSLRRGDIGVASSLLLAFRTAGDVDVRSLALEVLAGARVRTLESLVQDVIREALFSPIPELQFAAIAAASDLSRTPKLALGRVIRKVGGASHDASVVSAAQAFLRLQL